MIHNKFQTVVATQYGNYVRYLDFDKLWGRWVDVSSIVTIDQAHADTMVQSCWQALFFEEGA